MAGRVCLCEPILISARTPTYSCVRVLCLKLSNYSEMDMPSRHASERHERTSSHVPDGMTVLETRIAREIAVGRKL